MLVAVVSMERNGEIDWPVGQVNSKPVYLGDWDMTLVWLLVIVALFIGLVGAKSSKGGDKRWVSIWRRS